MNNISKIIRRVAKSLDMDTKNIQSNGGRYYLTDTFTTIIAAKKSMGILQWAEAHKIFTETRWESIKDGTFKPHNEYTKLMQDKMLKCNRKPEVDIVLVKSYDDIDVVVYTDTLDGLVAEAERFKKGF